MTELLFVRHGETDWNVQMRFQGQIDVPLNATGLRQAQALARRLAAAESGADRADALLSSDLQRAQQTAAPLAAAWALPVASVPGLREQAFGVLEGLDFPTVISRHPELFARWREHRADYALPGGESRLQFHTRVLAAVHELATQHSGRRLVVVTHGGVLDILWRAAQGLSLDGPRVCAIPNTGLNRLRWRDGTLELLHWADDAHLQPMPAPSDPVDGAGPRPGAVAAD
jgi:2,3-bisphosphoglycerate-dependent phosphoglycerate mutase